MKGPDFIIFGGGGFPGGNPNQNPPWTDPAKFPRAAPIQDEESLLRIAQIERLLEQFRECKEEIVRLNEQLAIVQADMDAQKARLFPTLRKLHPDVINPGTGYGWRKHDGRYYVVGWDEETVIKAVKEQHDGEEN